MTKYKSMGLSGCFAFLIWGGALVSLPIGPVPLSLQSVVIFLAALLLPMRYALLAVFLYILMGIIGLPVFTGGKSGIEAVTGITAGFFVGFLLMVIVISFLTKNLRFQVKNKSRFLLYWHAAWPCILGTIVLQLCGILWGKYYTGDNWYLMLDKWLYPFFFNMGFKIILAAIVSVEIWVASALKSVDN